MFDGEIVKRKFPFKTFLVQDKVKDTVQDKVKDTVQDKVQDSPRQGPR